MACHECQYTRMIPVRQRNAAVSRTGQCCADSRDDFIGDIMLPKVLQFFATASKNKRITAFEPDHGSAQAGLLQHQGMNFLLAAVMITSTLADVDPVRIPTRQVQHVFTDQLIVQDDISLTQYIQGS